MQRSSRVSALGLVLSLIALAALARGNGGAPARDAAPTRSYVSAPASVGPVDINTATAEELIALPRIGPALAARIILDREQNGAFVTLEALDRVPGIGPRTIELLRPHATVSSPSAPPSAPN